MCIGPLLAAAALSAGGSLISTAGANRQANQIADARNKVLRSTMAQNDEIAARNRQVFDSRTAGYQPDQFQQSAADATAARAAPLDASVAEPTATPISGSAPAVVQSTLAKTMAETMEKGKADAGRLAKVGSYGDTWFNQGLANTGAGRDVGVNNDFAAGNLSIMPYLQDYAEIAATKPNWLGTLGSVMSGVGNIIGARAGAGGGMPKAPVPKVTGLPTWGGPR